MSLLSNFRSVTTILPRHDEITEYSLRLHESNFYNNGTGRRATLPEMLMLLDNVTEILIPASFDIVCTHKKTCLCFND